MALVVLVFIGAAVAQAAGAGAQRARAARATTFLGTLKIRLPPGGKGQIWELILKVKARRGRVGSLGSHDLNDSRLPPGVRAVEMITPQSSDARTATFTVFVAINNLGGSAAPATVSLGDISIVEYTIGTLPEGTEGVTGMVLKPEDCVDAIKLGNSIDNYSDQVTVSEGGKVAKYGGKYVLERERPGTIQPSSNESVVDYTVRAQCPPSRWGGVETTIESPESLT